MKQPTRAKTEGPTQRVRTGSIRTFALAALALTATAFLAHFLHFRHFGLYEDDYWSIANTYNCSFHQLGVIAHYDFRYWPTGRPLNHLLPSVLSVVGYRLGGLPAMYLIAAAWLSLNGILVYSIARRFLSMRAALVAGIAYLVFPADTTKELLIHVSHIQGAMTFLLLGLLLWLSGGWKQVLSYPVAALSLLSYETAFIGFLLAPLLVHASKPERRWRRWLVHGITCGAILFAIAIIRVKTGDSRSVAVLDEPLMDAWRSLSSMVLGPLTDLWAYVHAGYTGMAHVSGVAALSWLGILLPVIVYWRAARRATDTGETTGTALGPLATACAITWAASYALTLVNYPPTQVIGRLTSTHIAAGWPVALLCGCGCEALMRHRQKLTALWVAALAGALMLLLAYTQYVQRQYMHAWSHEKAFWRQVLALCPDVDAHTSIIVTGLPYIQQHPYILVNSWADYHACVHLFGLTSDNSGPKFANLGAMGPQISFKREGDRVLWTPEFWSNTFLPIDPADLILLKSDGGHLTRVRSAKTSVGVLVSTRPIPQGSPPAHPDTYLYRLITQD